jgi:hypothetical protein
MLLLIVGDFFQRRPRGPRYAQDELPVGPLIDVFSLWILLTVGGFLGAAAFGTAYLMTVADLPLGLAGVMAASAMALLSPVCFWRALLVWYRLTR